jgi:hypothetical protein
MILIRMRKTIVILSAKASQNHARNNNNKITPTEASTSSGIVG